MNRTPRSRFPMPTRVWAWVVAAMFLVQGAVPLLAAAAASQRGVSLAEVCSVYGVRTVEVDAAASGSDSAPIPGQHAGGLDCSLIPLLASAALGTPMAAVFLHAPQQALATQRVDAGELPADASWRWLARRLHAPPLSV